MNSWFGGRLGRSVPPSGWHCRATGRSRQPQGGWTTSGFPPAPAPALKLQLVESGLKVF